MRTDPKNALEDALSGLREERDELNGKIAALEKALEALGGARRKGRRASAKRRNMSTAARRAVSKRMKAYWAKRRAEKAKKS